jgi:hypothetical protein
VFDDGKTKQKKGSLIDGGKAPAEGCTKLGITPTH